MDRRIQRTCAKLAADGYNGRTMGQRKNRIYGTGKVRMERLAKEEVEELAARILRRTVHEEMVAQGVKHGGSKLRGGFRDNERGGVWKRRGRFLLIRRSDTFAQGWVSVVRKSWSRAKRSARSAWGRLTFG